jgi:hypothetical protein
MTISSWTPILAAGALLGLSTMALANAFDDCVLEKMPSATSDLVAKSIKTACLRKSSVDLTQDDLHSVVGEMVYGAFGSDGEPGFMVDLKNDTNFIVTEVTVAVAVEGKAASSSRPTTFGTGRRVLCLPGRHLIPHCL